MRTSQMVSKSWDAYFQQKDRTKKLLDELAEENIELKRTVEKYQTTKGGSKQMTKQFLSLKKEMAAKNQECQHLQEQLNKASMQIQVYEAVAQQIDKLQGLQNQLISENQKLKEDREELWIGLRKIKKLLEGTKKGSKQLQEISGIINETQKKVPILQN